MSAKEGAMIWIAVGMGGALGSMLRHGVNVGTARWIGAPGPWGTFTVNMVGSLTIGVLAGLLTAGRIEMTPTMRTFVFVGIIGGFTTFSSYMLDALTLAQSGNQLWAVLNVVGQVALGYALVFTGYRVALLTG
jgi:fluoride exporter